MIDPQLLKTDLETIQTNLKKRDLNIDLQNLKKLDEDRRESKFESERLRSEQKKLGKEIAISGGDEKAELLKKAEKLSTKQLDLKTAEYNKTLSDFLKGKKYEDLIKLSKNDLADLYNQKNFSAHKGAGDPLRSKEYGPLLDKVFKDRGIGLDSQGNYKKLLRNEGDPPPKNYLEGGNFEKNNFIH